MRLLKRLFDSFPGVLGHEGLHEALVLHLGDSLQARSTKRCDEISEGDFFWVPSPRHCALLWLWPSGQALARASSNPFKPFPLYLGEGTICRSVYRDARSTWNPPHLLHWSWIASRGLLTVRRPWSISVRDGKPCVVPWRPEALDCRVGCWIPPETCHGF